MRSVHPMMLLVLALLAALPGATAGGCDALAPNAYHGSCGAFAKESSCWMTAREICGDTEWTSSDFNTGFMVVCTVVALASFTSEEEMEAYLDQKWCMANSEGDCCDANIGMIVGIVIGVVVFLGTSPFRHPSGRWLGGSISGALEGCTRWGDGIFEVGNDWRRRRAGQPQTHIEG